MLKVFLLCVGLVPLLGGCSTYMHGSAVAPDGNTVYVVGGQKGFGPLHPVVWRCPKNPGVSDKCVPMEIVEENP